ncbi:MAG: hypothetical protein LBG69_03660 [Zoogloeaceae bacterium]|jgi:hypothetical protein|nr:hypothetical protein [Zoogloeaceae bacterium]
MTRSPLFCCLYAKRQQGAALLLIVFFLLLGGLSWKLWQERTAGGKLRVAREQAAARSLALAKEALLGYAAAYPESRAARAGFPPGFLPCPDMGGMTALGKEGAEAGTCGGKGVSALGHFPWRSLGLTPPRDGVSECLWYLVSGGHKASPKGDLLNPDTSGLIEILAADGQTVLDKDAVAVLFAPGTPVFSAFSRQTRGAKAEEGECRLDYEARQFLESLTQDGVGAEAEGVTRLALPEEGNAGAGNDRLLWISRAEWEARQSERWGAADFFATSADFAPGTAAKEERAIAQRLAVCLMRFGAANTRARLPWAAPLELTASAPETFHFDRLADAKNRLAGRPPYSAGRSIQTLAADLSGFSDCPASNLTHSACRLLIKSRCPEWTAAAGPINEDNSQHGWWDKWKDHFFYLVAPGFSPGATPPDAPPPNCAATPEACLLVHGHFYAAAVIFAGAALPEQRREGNLRMDAAQYLEGQNAVSVKNGGRILEAAGNDEIACIAYDADGEGGGQFRLVPHCGAQDCRSKAARWRQCAEAGRECAEEETLLSGCAAFTAAARWRAARCPKQSGKEICRAVLRERRFWGDAA